MSASDRDPGAPGRPEYSGPRDRLGRPLPSGSRDELAGRPEPGRVEGGLDRTLEIGAGLFDEQKFFEAHEFFEHVWKSDGVEDRDRDFWKGVAQVAVGFCHVQRGNRAGAVAVLGRAIGNLGRYPSPHRRVETRTLEAAARDVVSTVETTGVTRVMEFPRFPMVEPAPGRPTRSDPT